jgi:hypothetical protein
MFSQKIFAWFIFRRNKIKLLMVQKFKLEMEPARKWDVTFNFFTEEISDLRFFFVNMSSSCSKLSCNWRFMKFLRWFFINILFSRTFFSSTFYCCFLGKMLGCFFCVGNQQLFSLLKTQLPLTATDYFCAMGFSSRLCIFPWRLFFHWLLTAVF